MGPLLFQSGVLLTLTVGVPIDFQTRIVYLMSEEHDYVVILKV